MLVSLHFEEFTILLYHVESESDGGEYGEMDVDLTVHEAVSELSCQIYVYEPDPLSGVVPLMAAGTEPAQIVLSEEMVLFSIFEISGQQNRGGCIFTDIIRSGKYNSSEISSFNRCKSCCIRKMGLAIVHS